MTNFERVMELAGELQSMTISSNDGFINSVTMDIDTCDVYDNELSISSLNGDEIIIYEDNIVSVNDNVVKLKGYVISFEN